ncbi:MAG: hypothetical protein FWE44_03005 [Defluviitaleaceae bacterium]|nr:hypothetical protein [Defluviitaleaceae bacterium]
MIDFKKEIKKFEPVLEIEDIEDGVMDDGAKDMMELLQFLFAKQNKNGVGAKK